MTRIYPGPSSIDPDQCPGGVVIHHYAVPSQELILVSHITMFADARQVADTNRAQLAGFDAICLVAYDGDSGERMEWPE